MNQKKGLFTGKEFISEIMEKMPVAQEIFAAHGLACAGCHINVYETLEQGALGHGMDSESIKRLIDDLNDAAENLAITTSNPPKNPVLTDIARQKVLEFQSLQSAEGFGFKIEVDDVEGDISYHLDFLEKPEKGDIIIETNGINLFLDKQSLRLLQNYTIDYGKNEHGEEGFKVDK